MKMKKILFVLFFTLVAFPANAEKISSNCTLNGKKLYGKVKIVDHFPDFKVQIVDHLADFKIQKVTHFPGL